MRKSAIRTVLDVVAKSHTASFLQLILFYDYDTLETQKCHHFPIPTTKKVTLLCDASNKIRVFW